MKSGMILAALLALSLAATPAFAQGGGGGGGGAGGGAGGGNNGGSNNGGTLKKCKKNEVLDKNTNKCIKVSQGILPDEQLYEEGSALADAGEFEWALTVLSAIRDQNDPRVLNYTGYANRKAGRLDVAVGYYRKALAINPDFVRAREYLGEGYVAAGRIDLAKAELNEIAMRCGTSCEEYQALAEHIETGL